MKLIKLTDKNNQTRNKTQWGASVRHELPATDNPELCSGSVLHAYKSINQALLMRPVHGVDKDFNIWEAEGEVVVEDATKVGVFKLTTNQIVQPPKWYTNLAARKKVQVKFAILCAKATLHIFEEKFPDDKRPRAAIEAAESWLKGYRAAAADNAAHAANAANAANAAYAADAAYAAAYAADAAYAAYAAAAAADAADAAAYAAAYAAADAAGLDLVKLADEAVDYVENETNNQA